MAPRRGPSVLVTDARERPPTRGSSGHRRSGTSSSSYSQQDDGDDSSSSSGQRQRLPMRHVSVDNVLQNATEIPSGQPRGPPGAMHMLPTSASSALSAASSAARRRGLVRRSSSSFGINASGGALAGGAGGVGASGAGLGSGVLIPGSASVGIGGSVVPLSRGAGLLPNVPSRTTKISEKLVLLPETEKAKSDEDEDDEDDDDDEGGEIIVVDDPNDDDRIEGNREAAWAAWLAGDENADVARRALQKARQALEDAGDGGSGSGGNTSLYDGVRPPRDEELDVLRKRGGIRGKSYAERLPKGQRTEKVARLTAYCTAQAFKMRATAEFLRTHHAAKTKMYDDCLYTVYHLPLLPGHDGFRVRSRPMLKTPGTGKTVLDLEIERSERRDEHMGFYEAYTAQRRESGNDGGDNNNNDNNRSRDGNRNDNDDGSGHGDSQRANGDASQNEESGQDEQQHDSGSATQQEEQEEQQTPPQHLYSMSSSPGAPQGVSANTVTAMSPVNRLAPDAKHFAEMFVFSYGVVVFWNFTEHQEKDILADLSFAGDESPSKASAKSAAGVVPSTGVPSSSPGSSLVTRPLDEADFETEEFHFEYSASVQRPRVFNDMITLLPRSDHMVKLTISHAIAQSTKLCFFEEKMSETMQNAQHVPKQLALTGELNMSRTEIVKILGRLFKNRVDINLSSNILDVPNFFWDAEPTLHPLYVAIREYLEIDPRIQVLNERCRVFLDLAEILANSIADAKMSYITWIVIILIVLSIFVTVTEVVLRFSILENEKGKYSNATLGASSDSGYLLHGSPPVLQIHQPTSQLQRHAAGADLTIDELRAWAAQLDARERAGVCGGDIVGQTFAGV